MPPVVQAFLSSYNLAGKLIIPFITHGGYGKGDSDDKAIVAFEPGSSFVFPEKELPVPMPSAFG